MSEPKRIALIPLAAAEVAQASLPAKKDKKSTTNVKTHRFTLALPDSTEKSCPEFNFADLIAALTKKKDGHATNGSAAHVANSGPLDPYAEDDEDHLRIIAKKFEEKYGMPASKKKKSRKYDEYVDLGAGYDENDPFIDNTDAYDEIVPAEVTTAHGGFYINSGALEFKPVEKRSDSESESESESSESESDDSLSESSTTHVSSNKKRRVIESDDDDSQDEIQLNGSEGEETEVKKKKPRLEESISAQPLKKKKASSPSDSGVSGEANSAPLKKPRSYMKEMSQQKREHDKPNPETEKNNKNQNSNLPVPPIVSISTSPSTTVKELLLLKREKEKDAVDLIAGNKTSSENAVVSTDTSSDSTESSSESSESESGGDDDEDGRDADVTMEESDADAKLPNNLSHATLTAIEDIKKAASISDQQGKCRFFSPEINRLLLAIELQARQYSCSKRQAIYTHLTRFLPCTKHTLLKRAKNLVLDDVDAKLKPAIRKLQLAVEKVIGEQIERHATQCQRLAEAKDPELEPAGGTDEEDKKPEKINKQPQPRRKFQWNKDIRSILNQVVYLKADCYSWSKLRKETATEYLLRFLDSEIRLLWPKGWMTAKILFKESQEAHSFVTSKTKMPSMVKKPVTSRTGLVDTLVSPSSSTPTVSLQTTSNASGPSFGAKELKKSQLRDRIQPLAPQPVARQDANFAHHRNDSLPNLSSGKAEKLRSELGTSSTKSDNGTSKLEAAKHRQRPGISCSSARTEGHHVVPRDCSKKQSDSCHTSNNNRNVDASQTSHPKSEHALDSAKLRTETNISKPNAAQTRSDLGVVKSENNHSLRASTVDSMKLHQDRKEDLGNPVTRGTETNKQSRSDGTALSDSKNRFELIPKIDSNQTKGETIHSDIGLINSSKLGKHKSNTVGSSMANSLASFVDSGLRWTETSGVLDLSDDHQQPRQPSKVLESHANKETASKIEETEDQESLLQRDLAMVLEEISQITRLVEGKDHTVQQPLHSTKACDSRTKSVIKTTGSSSPSSMHSPLSTSNTSKLTPTGSSTASSKLTSTTRTPPPQALQTSINRVSSSPTSGNTSVNLISPTQMQPPRTISPVTSDHLKSGHGKYNANLNKPAANEYMTPPTAHSSNRHSGNFFPSDQFSPEKRKVDGTLPQQSQPPLPAHQQHASTNSVPRSSPNALFRNYPTSSAQAVPTPSNSLTVRGPHSIESLMQTKKNSSDPTLTTRPISNAVSGPTSASSQQSLPKSALSKHDPLAIFLTQKNSQKNSQGDYNYYTQPGAGHHQHSS